MRGQRIFHRLCKYRRSWRCGEGSLTVPYAQSRLASCSRTVINYSQDKTLRRTTLNSPGILLQRACFSTGGEEKAKLLINPAEVLPELYSSPAAVLETEHDFDCKSTVINKDGEDELWHTAKCILVGDSKEHFHSGKFSEVMNQKFSQNEQWKETCIVDGKVYYRDESTAKEAAAARALDCLAFRLKYKNMRTVYADDTEPIRYCEELPYLFPMFGENTGMGKHCYAPAYYWSCLMQAKYGPIDAMFEFQHMSFGCDTANGGGEVDNKTWFSATCIEPKTGEVFESGVFRSKLEANEMEGNQRAGISGSGRSCMPEAPITPLPLEEFRVIDGKVYYRDESTAKHAAAARAIDCLNLRTYGNENPQWKTQLCFEEPYMAPDDKQHMQQTNYEEAKAIVESRREGNPGFSFFDVHSQSQERVMRNPLSTLENGWRKKFSGLFNSIVFGKHESASLKNEDGVWYTAAMTDPTTKETFSAGVVRAPKSPNGIADIKVLDDGKVYYKDDISHAINAAAARAIDCYMYREDEKSDIRLCYEEPYKTAEEGESQSVDYDVLLAQRDEGIKSIDHEVLLAQRDEGIESSHTPKTKATTFSSLAESSPEILHVPKAFLQCAFQNKHGQGKFVDPFDVQETEYRGKRWWTATFQDPITEETFSSGLGREIDVEINPSARLRTPLHKAEVKVVDEGKVYYRDRKSAEHAAAARAIDCYIFRENDQSNLF